MPKTVKLDAKQLRSLIISEAKKLRENVDEGDMYQGDDLDQDMYEQDDADLDEASGEAYGVGGVHEFAASCVNALSKFADLENVELPTRTKQLFRDVATDFYLKNVKPEGV